MSTNYIIDVHVHITPPEVISNYKKIGEKEPYFNMLSSSPINKFATAEDIIKQMEQTGVSKSVVFGFSFLDSGLCKEANDYTIEMVKKYPDKLIGYASVSPTKKGLESEIDRCLQSGLEGIGELFPDGQGFSIDDKNATNDLCGFCLERNIPIMVHSNEPVGHYYNGKTETTPVKIAKFAENHPDNKVIFAHLGGGLLFYELMPEMKKLLKNVYYDTAALPFLFSKEIYKTVKEAGIFNKLLFGTDFPLLSPKRYIDTINSLDLTDNDKKMLYYDNFTNIKKVC